MSFPHLTEKAMSYICLLLDKDCQVVLATLVRGTLVQAEDTVERMVKERDVWGYEIWHENERVRASYECNDPPGRSQARV